ncbi:uncharacterized protein EV422DRAFT_502397 [Fimicolochytrium jonesii]|uniref:uncharacterized protein n=1 Tax=Fimicolochytrium jonesii TaxID=1396493 RepID=UPI0022FDBD0C|nr:uncharacterized protein EV422DRAFT_502397 [Fimicolochytrium jonesii]KAI8826619.1 hypothetical protein EV422DRAFT_502397 [Fimicolochytrium jonesii]
MWGPSRIGAFRRLGTTGKGKTSEVYGADWQTQGWEETGRPPEKNATEKSKETQRPPRGSGDKGEGPPPERAPLIQLSPAHMATQVSFNRAIHLEFPHDLFIPASMGFTRSEDGSLVWRVILPLPFKKVPAGIGLRVAFPTDRDGQAQTDVSLTSHLEQLQAGHLNDLNIWGETERQPAPAHPSSLRRDVANKSYPQRAEPKKRTMCGTRGSQKVDTATSKPTQELPDTEFEPTEDIVTPPSHTCPEPKGVPLKERVGIH